MEKTIHVVMTEDQRDTWIEVCNADIAASKTEIERWTKRLKDSVELRDKLIANHSTIHSKPSTKLTVNEEPTVSKAVLQLLEDAPAHEMHLDRIQAELQAQFGIQMTRKNLSNTLNRWLQRGKMFVRTRTNTYAPLRTLAGHLMKNEEPTIAARAVEILSGFRELHIKDLLTKINRDGGERTQRDKLARVLTFHSSHGKNFKRTKPDTYALLEKEDNEEHHQETTEAGD